MSNGKCLCGAIEIEAPEQSQEVGACHCEMCRRWGGGPLLAVDCGTQVQVNGDSVSEFNSSDWAVRGFCNLCGTHLYYKLKQTGQCIIPAGLFDSGNMVLDHEVFVDEQPKYYGFANQTHRMTGAEVFAMFAGENKD